jgi:glycine/D-amino acid oxidase-like deaminating enzyme
MHVEYLIVGQGICGTWLSWYLQKENKKFLIIDKNEENTPSKISAGIINPVTGRRLVKVWLADEVLPFAWQAYKELGSFLHKQVIYKKNLIDFFPNPHQRLVFLERIEEKDEYLHSYPEQNEFNPFFNYELGCGEIRQCYTVNLEEILNGWREELINNGSLIEEEFQILELELTDERVKYKDIVAEKIIFCDGLGGALNPYFEQLPFAPNKGEALIVEINDLPDQHIYKKGFMLAPIKDNIFWFGSNYQWKFDDPSPSKEFSQQAARHLSAWLKLPYKILDHKAGIRPATIERRPFVGLHPHQSSIGILNGMGTKGCSLAPYFANQLVQQLVNNEAIFPEAGIQRFSKILQR